MRILMNSHAAKNAGKFSVVEMVEFHGYFWKSRVNEQLELVYKHFEKENSCKIGPSYENAIYAEFDEESKYTWFLLRWS